MSLGIGLIGLGRHGMRYAQHLLDKLPSARLVAVCRRDAARGRAFAAEHSLLFFENYRDLLADNNVQAVVVVTPPSQAYPICLEAVKAGKPLLTEKPLACTAAEAYNIVHAAASAEVPIMTAHTLRFDQTIMAFKAKLASVGRPRYLVLTCRIEPKPELWRENLGYGGRGVLLEVGIHLLDLIRFLTGEEIADVRCEMEYTISGQSEFRALASLHTTSGLACILDVSRVSAGRVGRAEWMGDEGQMMVDWVNRRINRLSWHQAIDQWTFPQYPTIVATLSAFVDALVQGTSMPITGRDGLKAVESADACYKSATSGQTVRISHERDRPLDSDRYI